MSVPASLGDALAMPGVDDLADRLVTDLRVHPVRGRPGASFTSAMVFELASTNLVIELGIIMALLLGWQFTLAEFVGGPIIIVLFAGVFPDLRPPAAHRRRP
jgi:hypothetical protein